MAILPCILCQIKSPGAVAELADALDLGSSFFGSAGSTPVSPIAASLH